MTPLASTSFGEREFSILSMLISVHHVYVESSFQQCLSHSEYVPAFESRSVKMVLQPFIEYALWPNTPKTLFELQPQSKLLITHPFSDAFVIL